jgi:hypothetical protein
MVADIVSGCKRLQRFGQGKAEMFSFAAMYLRNGIPPQ